MPDFYTRMHAASVIETLGAGLILLGLMLQAGFTLVAVKLLMVGLLIFFASPTATHALARAAMVRGLKPLLADDGERVIETLIINVLLVLMAVAVCGHRAQPQPVRRHRARRHLQLPDGHRAGRAWTRSTWR